MDEQEIFSLLFSAIQHHNVSLLEDLLESDNGVKLLDVAGKDGNMLLHTAVMENDIGCVHSLLGHGADPNVFDAIRARSPLHLAVELGLTDIVGAFLELQHVNLELRDDRNLTCYEIAQFCDNQKLADLICHRRTEIEKFKNEFYALMNRACTSNDIKLVKELVTRYERKILQSLPKSWHQNADKRNFARNVLKDLINWSSSIWNDVTLLFKSASKGHTEICKLLIDLGAAAKGNENTNHSPLYVAAYGGYTPTVKLMLDSFPHLIQQITIEKWTVLHACCLQGHSETAKLVLNYPYPETLKQRYVTRSGQYEYNFAFNLNAQDAAGQTVIYLAVSANNESLLDTLLEFNIKALYQTGSSHQEARTSDQRGHQEVSKSSNSKIIPETSSHKSHTDNDKNFKFYKGNQLDKIMKQLRRLQFSKNIETTNSEKDCVKDEDNRYLICPFELDTYCDYNSKTALHHAVIQQYHNIATTLLVNGSDPNLPILFKDMAKDELKITSNNLIRGETGLNWVRSSKSTCLKEACKLNDITMCECLIRYGARDTQDNLALQVAATNQNHCLISMFLALKSNMDPEYKINRKCNVEFASRYKQSQKLSKTSQLGDATATTTFSSMFPSTPVTIDWRNLYYIQHVEPQWLIDASLALNKRLRHPTNSLMAITRLDLSSNKLKSVHPVIFRLPSLRELNLSSNRLEFLPDLSQISHEIEPSTPTSKLIKSHRTAMKRSKSSNFTGMNLESSNIIDLNEVQEWDLPALEVLDVHDNLLMSLPDCLFDLPKLRELDVSSNQLRQLPWAIWNSNSLCSLIASGNLLDDLPKAPPHSNQSIETSSALTTISDSETDSSLLSPKKLVNKLESSYASSSLSEIVDNREPQYFANLRKQQIDMYERSISLQSFNLEHLNYWSKRIDLVNDQAVPSKELQDADSISSRGKSFTKLTYINLSHNSFITIPPVLACVATELTRLNMSYNRIESLGDICLYPAKLKTLDLSNNRLISWFQFSQQDDDTKHCYVENIRGSSSLKSCRSHNQLYCLHKIHQRLDYLRSLNISHNLMRDIQLSYPNKIPQSNQTKYVNKDVHSSSPHSKQGFLLYPNVTAVDVSFNHIQTLPDGLSDLKDLSVLNLSGNPSITRLPTDLGLSNKLWNLAVTGCNLGEPLKSIVESKSYKTMDIIGYLKSILEEAKPYARMKLMLVGLQGIGKTSLLEQMRLEGKSGSRRRAPEHWTKRMGHTSRGNLKNQKGVTLSTVGVDIHDWIYQKRVPRNQHSFGPVSFSTWDFGGQEEFYATHRYFLSRRSLYLVVWRLTDGVEGIMGIQQWLVNIQSRAPGSPVIIVGTHEDMVDGGENGKSVQELQAEVLKRFIEVSDHDKCGFPKIMDSIFVSTKTKLNIKKLCNRIYDVVFSLKCPGSSERLLEQKIPATYLYLEEIVNWIVHERLQRKREPVLTYDEYRKLTSSLLKSKYNKEFRDLEPLNSCEINYNSELQQATRFLHENGVLLHYEDSNLRDLYFLDPQWLCDILSHVVTIREINPHVKNGLMKMDDLQFLFKSMDINLSGGVQSYVVNLLNKFEVALTWNSQYLLIPSLLPSKPSLLDVHQNFYVNLAPKMRGRSVIGRLELDRSTARSNSIDPSKRRDKLSRSGDKQTDNFYEFEYKSECAITRLVLLRYLPAGFLARLQSGILSDSMFDEACEEMYHDLSEQVGAGNESSNQEFEDILGNRPSWLCWRRGIRLTIQQELMINTKNDPNLLAPNLMTIEEYSTCNSPEFSQNRLNFKIENLHIDCAESNQRDESASIIDSKWIDYEINQFSNIIMIVLPNPRLKVTKKEDRSIKYFELNRSSLTKLLARVVDCIDDLLEDWYPSLGIRFAHTLGGNYLVNRVVPCHRCSPNLLAMCNTVNEPDPQNQRLARSERAAPRQLESGQSKLNQSSSYAHGDCMVVNNPAKDVHCYYVEHCILNAYDLTTQTLTDWNNLRQNQTPAKTRNLYCPKHGAITISNIAPDIMFDDIPDSYKIDTEQIQRCKLIGRGSLGFVFKGSLVEAFTSNQLGQANQEVALKLLQPIDPGPGADQSDLAAYQSAKTNWSREPFQGACKSYCTARHEVNILQSIQHSNIVSFIGLCARPLAIVLELAPMGSLADVFKNYNRACMRIDRYSVQKSILQVAKALEFLHQHRIIYRDLKTENILVWAFPSPFATQPQTAQVELKLADYGISRQALSTGIWKGFAGTISFLAPEILRHNGDEEYTEKVDCFSFGMFLYELITLRPPYSNQNEIVCGAFQNTRSHMSDGNIRPFLTRHDLIYPNYMLDLMSLCWSQEPQNRPTASQIVSLASTPEFLQVQDATTLDTENLATSQSAIFGCAIEQENGLTFWCNRSDSSLRVLTANQNHWTNNKNLQLIMRHQQVKVTAICLVDSMLWLCDSENTIHMINIQPKKINHKLDCHLPSPSPDQPLLYGDDEEDPLKSTSFSLTTNCHGKRKRIADSISSMIYEKRVQSVIFLTATGSLWILNLFDMNCIQLEDGCVDFNCMVVLKDTSSSSLDTNGDGFKLYCGQTNGISCLEIRNHEVWRQSILPLSSIGKDFHDITSDSEQNDETGKQSDEIVNIVASNNMLWTSAGCTVHLWSVQSKQVTRKLECWKLVPCSESLESIVIEQYYQQAKTSHITSLVHSNDQIFAATSHGCLIVIEASTLKPITVFRPCESNLIIMAPLSNRDVGTTDAQFHRSIKDNFLVAVGFGYRELMKRYMNVLEGGQGLSSGEILGKRNCTNERVAILLAPVSHYYL